MGKYMREAGEHINALSSLDLDPSELIDEIESITVMLHEASFYAGRMKAYARLMSQDRALFGVCISDHGLDDNGQPFGHGTGAFCTFVKG
jgi:hypothetical protein